MNYPRLLVLSNNSFSKSNSNGRTLGSLLKGWPKDKIAQFCISSDGPDFDVCENYYCVTDADVLRSFRHLTPAKRRKPCDNVSATEDIRNVGGIKKTTITMFARNILWSLGIWKGREFDEWMSDFTPEVILLQNGDSFFMHRLALKMSQRTGAKLAIFNTEGYYFFSHDFYGNDNKLNRLVFPVYMWMYRRIFSKFMRLSSANIYCNEALKTDYDKVFPNKNSIVCYTGSEIPFSPSEQLQEPPLFVYLGNLGIKRPEALAEFSQVLRQVRPDCHIDVYGNLPVDYNGIFERTSGIEYHGLVSYGKVKEIIATSDFIIHVEKDDPILINELRYAFSTKIADSICSGRNFIVYAPKTLACSRYIYETGAAWLASTKDELHNLLVNILSSADERIRVIERARKIASENHNSLTNSKKCQQLLCGIM